LYLNIELSEYRIQILVDALIEVYVTALNSVSAFTPSYNTTMKTEVSSSLYQVTPTSLERLGLCVNVCNIKILVRL